MTESSGFQMARFASRADFFLEPPKNRSEHPRGSSNGLRGSEGHIISLINSNYKLYALRKEKEI